MPVPGPVAFVAPPPFHRYVRLTLSSVEFRELSVVRLALNEYVIPSVSCVASRHVSRSRITKSGDGGDTSRTVPTIVRFALRWPTKSFTYSVIVYVPGFAYVQFVVFPVLSTVPSESMSQFHSATSPA